MELYIVAQTSAKTMITHTERSEQTLLFNKTNHRPVKARLECPVKLHSMHQHSAAGTKLR